MPKINVYVPDDLADSVKNAGVPVSALCQAALKASVRQMTAIRSAARADLDVDDPTTRLTGFTQRARTAVTLSIQQARTDGAASVGTEHLLHGVLSEGANLALHVLRAMEIEPDHVLRDLARTIPTDQESTKRFSGATANALELAVTESMTLGHHFVGCEHLLLGLLSEQEGMAGQVLRGRGADSRSTRRAITAALAGYSFHAQRTDTTQSTIAAIREEQRPLLRRIERLEEHAGLAGN